MVKRFDLKVKRKKKKAAEIITLQNFLTLEISIPEKYFANIFLEKSAV